MSSKSKTTATPNIIENSKFYTLTGVAYGAAQDIQAGDEVIAQFLHFAIEGYREFHFDHGLSFKALEIEMKSWKQIDFPCDMVDWNVVGFKCGDMIKAFTQDRNIPKTFDLIDCVPQENKPCPNIREVGTGDIVPLYYFSGTNYSADGTLTPQMYGNKVNYNYLGYFDVDWNKRVINFKKTIPNQTKVYIEYITDGINYDGETIVHPYAYKCLKDYIHWQRKEHDERVSEAAKERAKRIYEQKLDDVVIRQLNLTIQDIYEALWEGRQQTPKS